MGLLIYSFWFAPKCESVADCIHMGLLIYSFGLLPSVRVRCRLYLHGLIDLLFLVCSQVQESVCCLRCTCPMRESLLRTVPHGPCVSVMYLPHARESAADCTTWAVCVCDVLIPCVRVRCGLYHMGCVCL